MGKDMTSELQLASTNSPICLSEMLKNHSKKIYQMKTYSELTEELKEEARILHPTDFEDWMYKTIGVEIEFSAK